MSVISPLCVATSMGFELQYQAIPPDSDLIELARRDTEGGWALGRVPSWFSCEEGGPRLGREGEGENPIWDACCRLAGTHPELRARNCYLDRRWDVLHYLLSATRRGEPATDDDLTIDRAFGAGELIADHVRGGQGVPVRYLSPAVVFDLAVVVEPLDDVALARHYNPARLEAAAIYKFWADRADESEWERIVGYFARFREFFVDAARTGSAAIACQD